MRHDSGRAAHCTGEPVQGNAAHKNSTFSGQTVLLSYPAGSRRHDSKGSCPAANVSAALRGSKKTQTIGLRQYAQKNHVSLNPRARFDWTNRQVSWLPVIASKRLPRLASRVASCLETHGYSGGTAQDLHLIPFILGRVPVSNSIKLSIVYQIKKFSANLLFNQQF